MFIDYFMVVLPYQVYDNKFKIKCQPLNPLLNSNQDIQDLRIFRIKRKIIILVVEKPIYMGAHFSTYNIRITQALSFVKPKLSESGYPGFKDFQDKEENNYIGG